MQNHSLYIHIPFCSHRCGYCDFNTYSGLENLIPDYGLALLSEIQQLSAKRNEAIPIHTVFFGGGTPSLMPIEVLNQIIACLRVHFDISEAAEVTLEANPGNLSRYYLEGLQEMGINRLSLGMQSAHPGELALLERRHDFLDVIRAFTQARYAGFNNINLDLIFGLPEQTMERWEQSLELAIGLRPEHFALYALTIEPGTPFGSWASRGLLSMPNPDLSADMYLYASERLRLEKFSQYEISSWATTDDNKLLNDHSNPTLACQHNIQYWHNRPYLGLGAGAHGYASGIRTANVRSPQRYIQRLRFFDHPNQWEERSFPATQAAKDILSIDKNAEIAESMMMGLRLTREGISTETFQHRFGKDLRTYFRPQIERLIEMELLEWISGDRDRIRLTPRGRLLGNRVFREFL